MDSYSTRAKVKDVQPALAAAWALLGHKLPARSAGVRTTNQDKGTPSTSPSCENEVLEGLF